MDEELIQYVIYDHPADFPNHIVVRPWVVRAGDVAFLAACLCDSLEEAREMLAPFGLYRLDRYPEDDPTIVEVWL